jgi:hypothetical protein
MAEVGQGRPASWAGSSRLDSEAVERQRDFPVKRLATWGLLPRRCEIFLKAVAPQVLCNGALDSPVFIQ